jgi:hypothetical protein
VDGYLDVGHEQFIKEMDIGLTEIGEIFVPKHILSAEAQLKLDWEGSWLLVKILGLCSDSGKTSLDLRVRGIDGRGHDTPEPKFISNVKRQSRI